MSAVIPAVFVAVFIAAAAKKVNVFSSFAAGAGEGIKFTVSLLPMLAAVFMMCELFENSGLADALARALGPVLGFFGIPQELAKLALIKPFSGSGSLTLLTDVFSRYGADSYVSRCAATIYASSETVFYVFAVYFAGTDRRGRALPLAVVIISSALGTVLACALCRVL